MSRAFRKISTVNIYTIFEKEGSSLLINSLKLDIEYTLIGYE
jgi:hypothetical protein